jgi:tetratricopeptide (TPR) repeat protein
MKVTRKLLINCIIVLFCITVSYSLLAQENLPAIIKKIQPSVVTILTYDEKGKGLMQGSGFFIRKDGDIITNRHVLQGASSADVKTAQGKVYPITRVVAEDKEGDLILVSVDIPPDAVYPLSVSASIPEVGERVIVIGSPLGFEKTVSDGIVSAVREIPQFGKIIQITAPISPGSSGSPVVNMKGEVIGVATLQTVEGQNLNFAVPSEWITRLKAGKEQRLAEWEKGGTKEWRASAEGLYSTGLSFLWVEDYKKALPYFEEAIKKNPRYAEAYFQIGYCNYQRGRYTEAVEAFKQAIRIKPDDAKAHYNLGRAYSELGRYNEAIEAYKAAIRIKPDDAEAHYNLGVVYYKPGRYTEAIEAFKQAIRIKPDYAKAHYNLGVAYGKLGRYNEAIEAYKQAIRIKPDFADAHCYLGAAYFRLGRYPEAVEANKQAIRIKPDFADAHYNLGVVYYKLGRYPEAVEANKQAIRIKPDFSDAHYNLGRAYLLVGDKGSALNEYKILKTLNDDLADELFNLIYK